MRIVSLFLWILVPLALWWTVTTHGTPHLVVTYRFLDNGDRHNPHADRVYVDCTYWGLEGYLRVPARNADYPWVRFFKARS